MGLVISFALGILLGLSATLLVSWTREHDQLMTTRQRQLDRVLAEIDTLRRTTDFHALGTRDLSSDGVAGCRALPAEASVP